MAFAASARPRSGTELTTPGVGPCFLFRGPQRLTAPIGCGAGERPFRYFGHSHPGFIRYAKPDTLIVEIARAPRLSLRAPVVVFSTRALSVDQTIPPDNNFSFEACVIKKDTSAAQDFELELNSAPIE